MAFIFHLIFVSIAGTVLGVSGYGITTWQYWVILTCLIGSNIAGREQERK